MSQSISAKVKNLFKSMMKPSPAAVFQAVKSLKPHSPMIKFRYGGGVAGHSRMSAPPSPAMSAGGPPRTSPASTPTSPSKPNATTSLPIIEDWQLPARYQRRPIDPVEIEYINRGGPE
ncbi:28S ribosomal protein S36, mitochondrial [Orchesella cincta]|uniref:28S ribosomal protein S36, mitochondrial n=1 Tax=Orchesella cincta TaxID=48709 RepID=A0A1D2MYH0_ORCCI|nr:28S ribosomal protein S36, mitochondrial [Orchesella cincta]